MRATQLEEIEFLRKRIENLSIPINYSSKEEKKYTPKKQKKKSLTTKIDINKKEREKEIDILEKNFDEIYEIYNNDIEYKKELKEKERRKALKTNHIESIQFKGKIKQEKKILDLKFNINNFNKMLDRNNHSSRQESKYEDDFSSSDSYDSELFTLNQSAAKNFKFKTNEDIDENKENLKEIMRVLSLSQK